VVLESGGTAAGGFVVGVVKRVARGVGVAGLLCDLVGDAYVIEDAALMCLFYWFGCGVVC